MSTTTESPFSLTIKVGPNNDLLTGRADTVDEMSIRIQQLQALATQMQGVKQPVAPPTVEQAVENLAAAGVTGTVVPAGIEVKEDRFNNKYTSGSPDAGSCEHGPRIVKNGTNKAGRPYKAFVCVNDSPFRVGTYNKAAVCETTWPAKA
jgi:hypothetical protein